MVSLTGVPRACWASARSLQPAQRAAKRLRASAHSQVAARKQHSAPTCSASASASTSAAETTTAAAGAQQQERWAAFAANAAGEWEGVTATFGPTGTPQPLPEYYVPQAYAEWGVTLYDWQSQCSVRCDAEGLAYTHRRMMPTVGCEADAVAFTSQEQRLFAGAEGAEGSGAVAPDGSYSAGPADLADPQLHSAAVEACLVLAARQQRVRVVFSLRRSGGDAWRLASIDVHREGWEGPYSNGKVELRACGGAEGFAEKAALEAEALAGTWRATEGVEHSFGAGGCCSAEASTAGRAWSLSAGTGELVLLPLGVWASTSLGEDGGVSLEAGALAEDGTLRLASRRYSSGKLASASLQTLVRA